MMDDGSAAFSVASCYFWSRTTGVQLGKWPCSLARSLAWVDGNALPCTAQQRAFRGWVSE